ncbi:hypothetical protein ABZ805_21385 [Saccharopolyspora sp. NPDC047091]|uniref:hypothetical protein n=1 Tax=Saccharopolyspora sp. NPDC047091 TaxID=3155924 RepID=UPI00340571D0
MSIPGIDPLVVGVFADLFPVVRTNALIGMGSVRTTLLAHDAVRPRASDWSHGCS